jgi:hypothetical protein
LLHTPSRLRVLGGPLLSCCDSRLLILLPALGNIGSEGIVGVRGTEKGLDREKDSSDLKSGRPVVWNICQLGCLLTLCLDMKPTLENVKTDATKLINVGVEDLGKESDLGRRHGVVVG